MVADCIATALDVHSAQPDQHRMVVMSPLENDVCVSQWEAVELVPADPILGLNAAAQACVHPNKLNLGVGAYRTDSGQPYVLDVVRKAEGRISQRQENKEYLPSEGLATFRKATVDLLLGSDNEASRDGKVACIQSPSGTAALRIGASFVAQCLRGRQVYFSTPTWFNHQNIFAAEHLDVKTYRYFKKETKGLDIEGMLEDLSTAQFGSVVVLQGCAHNPTGVDPTDVEWARIAELCKRRNLLPFFDVAYQGFATGDLDKDAYAPRLFVSKGIEIMASQSYSKNMGLYGERVGSFIVVCNNPKNTRCVLSQLARLVRTIYSTPPINGARIVAEILNSPELFAEWRVELKGMMDRISSVRTALQHELKIRCPHRDWSFVTKQIGMFSYTGLTPQQVDRMINKHYVFMTRDGRISLAGLSVSKCEYLAKALLDCVEEP